VDRVQRLVLEDRIEDLVLVVAAERRLAEEHLVDENAKRPPVDGAPVALLEEDLECGDQRGGSPNMARA
jgi:hypothetical protein